MCPNNNILNIYRGACGAVPECAPLTVLYAPLQQTNPKRYSQQDVLSNGTLFPGLNLPLRAKPDAAKVMDGALAEFQTPELILAELSLHLDTHRDDVETLELYKRCTAVEKGAREKYEAVNGPVTQMATVNAET